MFELSILIILACNITYIIISIFWISIFSCTLFYTFKFLWIVHRLYLWTVLYTLLSICICMIWICIITDRITIFITIIYMILALIITCHTTIFRLSIIIITLLYTCLFLLILFSIYINTIICTLYWIFCSINS